MENRKQKIEIQEAIRILKSGGVIIFPTETSYGIGCDATNTKAVQRVFKIKNRPDGKGTPLIVDSLAMAQMWGVFNKTAKKLAKKYWPGALTIVVPYRRGSHAPPVVRICLHDKTVALRVSSHPIARALAKGLGRPLVATSANRSGESPCFTVASAKKIPADFFISGGTLRLRQASTLVRIINGQIEVLRKGRINPVL